MTSLNTHIRRLGEDHIVRAWIICSAVLLAWFVAVLVAGAFDDRTLDGVGVWDKPVKFAVSLALHLLTLAVLAQLLPRESRRGMALTAVGYAAIVATFFEQVYITVQAGRGRRSHFNFDTDFEILMYQFMGIGALVLVFASFFLGLMIWLRTSERTGLTLGAIIGLMLGSVMTLVIAGYLSSNGSHWVGQASGDATGLPLVGWSREVGDIRVAHFLATHTMQILPLVGLWLDRCRFHRNWIWLATAVLVGLAGGLFAQALAGEPLLPLS